METQKRLLSAKAQLGSRDFFLFKIMAFIPDEAEERFHELSPSAERFYIYLCKTRNHKTGKSFGTMDICAERYGWKRATKFAIVKELTSKGWISFDGRDFSPIFGDFAPVNKSKNLDSQSEKIDSQSKNLDYQSKKSDSKSKNLDSHIRNIPERPERPEKNNIYSAHEVFTETTFDAVDETHTQKLDETFLWIRQKKNLNRIPQMEWLELLADLETEGITLDGFKEFYLWVENLAWVTGTVSIKLLRGQIEAYKNREHLQAKAIIKNGVKENAKPQFKTASEIREQRAIDEYQFTEQLREKNRLRRESLRRVNA